VPSLDELEIAEEPSAWSAAGFNVADGVCQVARVRLRLVGKGARRGIGGWTLGDDMERTAEALGELLGRPRDAVQPGRRIATLRSEAGVGPAVAFMTSGAGAI
jgi:hypothetical protein